MRTDEAVMVTAAERMVLVSAQEYHRLKRRDREVLGLGDLTDADIAAIAAASVDPKYDYLNEELKDGEPPTCGGVCGCTLAPPTAY